MKWWGPLGGVASAIPVLLCLATLTPANAQILNGSFETGDFTDWNMTGFNVVEQYTTAPTADGYYANFEIHPTNGTYEGLAATDYFGVSNPVSPDALETFLGLATGTLNNIASAAVPGDVVDDGSAFDQTFSVASTSQLSFDWNFLTNETISPVNNDFGFYTLGSTATELADALNSSFIAMPGGIDAPYAAQTGWSTVSMTLTPGTYTLGFGAVNIDDNTVSSGLLVDNVTLTPQAPVNSTPEPGGLALLTGVGATGISLLGLRRRNRKRSLLPDRR